MIGKLAVLALLAVACVAGPVDHRQQKWILRNVYMTPKQDGVPPHRTGKDKSIHIPGKDSKIVGGTVVSPAHSYPWQSALYIDYVYFCGGSVISNDWVMTAGHCIHESFHVRVILGAQNINQAEVTQQEFISDNFFTHENYQPLTIKNDIALVHLPTSVTYNAYISAVALPASSDSYLASGTTVTPTGWGLDSDTATTISSELREVDVPTLSVAECQNTWNVDTSQICIDSTGGKGTCSGDSGGPLNYQGTTTWGITSYGASAGCEAGYPDVFTNPQYFLDWIQTNTGGI